MASKAELRAYARDAAARVGIDATNFERQIDQESGFNQDAHNDGSGADGLAQIVVRWHPTMAGKTRDPFASLDYAAGLMRNHLAVYSGDWALALSAYNAGPGATQQGLAGTLEGWPYAETVRYVSNILRITEADARARLAGAAPMPVTYNKNEPTHPQDKSFDCSQESLEWALWALGRKPADAWLETTMIAEGVMSPEQGLLDATGAGLAAFVVRHYGEDGFLANNEPIITFNWIAAEGGHAYPVLIGGRAWGHWAAVRDYDEARGLLLLSNPSDGWGGVGQTMNTQQFQQLGPFSAVRVWHNDLLAAQPPTPAPPADTRIARAKALAEHLLAVLSETG